MSKYTKELSKHLEAASNILLICHINPDGDAVGSQLALYHYLKSKGRDVEMISPNNLQEFIKWMDGTEKIRIYIKDRSGCKKIISEADLIVLLDFNQSGRLGEAENDVLKSGAFKIVIDHHLDLIPFTDLEITDSSRCSTSELIHELITGMNGGAFTSVAYSEAVYVGIVTDTGNFDHGSYNGTTFRIIAGLMDSGIDKDKILNLVFNNFTADRLRLQGYALNEKMKLLPELRTAYICLTKGDLARFNYRKGDTEGFVNLPLSIKNIDISALFIEKEGFVKISFRSKGDFSVSDFARKYFSGGGHKNASGGEMHESLDYTVKHFLASLEMELKK